MLNVLKSFYFIGLLSKKVHGRGVVTGCEEVKGHINFTLSTST